MSQVPDYFFYLCRITNKIFQIPFSVGRFMDLEAGVDDISSSEEDESGPGAVPFFFFFFVLGFIYCRGLHRRYGDTW